MRPGYQQCHMEVLLWSWLCDGCICWVCFELDIVDIDMKDLANSYSCSSLRLDF